MKAQGAKQTGASENKKKGDSAVLVIAWIGLIVVGALLAVGVSLMEAGSGLAKTFGFLALSMAAVNIFGGFLVTQRMLGMYKKREPKR